MALVGSYVGLSKWLVAVFPVFLLAWLRFGIAGVAMLGWLRPAQTGTAPAFAPLSRHDRLLLFLESFLGNFLFSVCMLYGIKLSTALAAGVIMAALPGAVALLSRVFLRERLSRRVLAGIACAVGGIALVSLGKSPAISQRSAAESAAALLGNLLLIGAVFCEASYVVIGKKLTGKLGARQISAYVNLWGLALVTPFGLWQALSFQFDNIALPIWTLLVFYALAASMITVWLWMTGLQHVPANQAGVFTVLLPISAAAIGVVFLGELVSTLQMGAFVLALAGVVLATWPARPTR
jgi:drug/metabolite transporter (DMT)-like permease